MAIRCYNCKDSHDTVQQVRDCHSVDFLGKEEPHKPSQRQLDYAHLLLRQREVPPAHFLADLPEEAQHESINAMSWTEISDLIGLMVEAPRRIGSKPTTAKVLVDPGMYQMNEEIYKVQESVNGTGHLYAKQLIAGEFVFVPGAINRLRPEHKMTLDQAKAYGDLYGKCCVCNRRLTNEQSIAAGIGPICANRPGMFA